MKNWLLMTVVVIFLWGLSAYIIMNAYPSWEVRGTVGDMFGAVNALFSGLAFAALIYTIILQREEIKANRSEIAQNRKELKKSTQAQLRSQRALQDQAAQAHLSSKLNAMNTIINYYNAQISNPQSSADMIKQAKEKRRAVIRSIDILIDGLEDSDIED